MTTTMQSGGGGNAMRPSPSGLADVVNTILDKGLVIDAYVREAVAGIELVTVGGRVVVESVDTCLRFADAISPLDISQEGESLPDPAGPTHQGREDDPVTSGQDTVKGVEGTVKGLQDTAQGALDVAGGILRDVAGGQQRRGRGWG